MDKQREAFEAYICDKHFGLSIEKFCDVYVHVETNQMLETWQAATRQMEADIFRAGAKAMFDFVRMSCANHFHSSPDIQKICDVENSYAEDLIEDALLSVSPDDMMEWKDIGKQQTQIESLQAEIEQLKNPDNVVKNYFISFDFWDKKNPNITNQFCNTTIQMDVRKTQIIDECNKVVARLDPDLDMENIIIKVISFNNID